MTMWNNVILCLGSNTDCEANLKSAASLLRAYFGSIRFSEAIYTEPIGLPDSGLFLNQVAVAGTNASLEEVRRAVKAMEKRLGRMSDSKQKGKIPIDIDLLLWNGTILKPADWEKGVCATTLPVCCGLGDVTHSFGYCNSSSFVIAL